MATLKYKGDKSVVGTTVDAGVLYIGVRGFPVMTVDKGYRAKLSPEVVEAAFINGMRQRIMDAAAKGRKEKDGTVTSATPAEKDAAMRRLYDHYATGSVDWDVRGGATGPRLDVITIQAIMKAFDQAEDTVRATVERRAGELEVTQAEYLAKMGTLPKVKAIADELRAAATSKIVLDEDYDPFAPDEDSDEDGEEEGEDGAA